jgi:hypothetical protein
MTLTNQNDIHDEIKSSSNSGNACYYSVQNLFVFPSPIKKPKYKNIQNCNFASCAIWLRNLVSHFEGGTHWGFLRTECWGGYLDLKGRKTDSGENCVMMKFTTCIIHLILLEWLNQRGWGGQNMWHTWGRGEVFRGFWLGGPKVRYHWEDLGIGGRITLN